MEPIKVPTVPAHTACVIAASCTGVTCCADVTRIGRSVRAFLNIDACEHVLMLGFEQFQFNVSLLNTELGVQKSFHLDQVFKIE